VSDYFAVESARGHVVRDIDIFDRLSWSASLVESPRSIHAHDLVV
jgi:hypothetical protein